MRILPVSLDAVLVELSGLDETLALLEALQADPVEGVVDLVPAARTLLVQFQPWVCTQAVLVAQIRSRQGRPRVREQAGELVQIPVRYDGGRAGAPPCGVGVDGGVYRVCAGFCLSGRW